VTKGDAKPMNPVHRLRSASRCTAKAKSTGERCRCPAVRGWAVCRVHGARGGHAAGPSHPQWKHGGRSQEVTQARALNRFLAGVFAGDQ
jgi:hypothetical protein